MGKTLKTQETIMFENFFKPLLTVGAVIGATWAYLWGTVLAFFVIAGALFAFEIAKAIFIHIVL